MKYDKHQVIEVHHQYGIKVYECESFWDAAINDGDLNSMEYATLQDAIDSFGDDAVPAKLAAILNSGSAAIEVWGEGDDSVFFAADKFDKEKYAIRYLERDLHRMIIIDSEEDAQNIADNYRGHEEIKVRAAARQIIEHWHIMND